MGPREESWKNYEWERRRLNARLGLTVFALLPLPAIFIAVGLSPLRMLLGSSVVGHGHWNSVSDVVKIEAQSTPCFGFGSANTPDCLGRPANPVFYRPPSNAGLYRG